MNGLRFFPSSHRYKLDGQWVPGVTSILGVIDKPGLKKWAAAQVAEYVADNRDAIGHLYDAGRGPMVAALKEIPWQRTTTAADDGTTFHDFAERILLGEEVEVPDRHVGKVESALAFMEDYHIEPVMVEGCVGSRQHNYAGKVDLIADSTLGRCIFDWKSGRRIYASTAYQLSAYANADFYGENGDEKPIPSVEASYGVHIRDDGYDVYPLAFGPDVWAEFLHIRATFAANKRAEGDWRSPGTGYVGIPLTPPNNNNEGSAA